jgi:serine/threonine-protein kinase
MRKGRRRVTEQAIPEVGSVIAGRYRLVEQIGSGAMGTVWRADHLTLGSPVAIKLIDASIAEHPEAFARFEREAQSAAALRSPHVVDVFDYGVDGGVPYIAMELLEGETLGARIAREGTISPQATQRIFTQMARGVSKAHEAGIVHRDLKPDNVFLVPHDDEDFVKILDFGIAKSSALPAATSGTKTGVMIGTPFYMSPEQAQGLKTIDARTDLWALGVIAFECLTGKLPFESEAIGELVLQVCVRPIPVPSSVAPVPPGFDAWFARATERALGARFQSAKELADALRAALEGGPERSPSGTWLGPGGVLSPHASPPSAASPAAAGEAIPLAVAVTNSAVELPERRSPRPGRVPFAIGLVVLLAGLLGAWFARRSSQIEASASSEFVSLPSTPHASASVKVPSPASDRATVVASGSVTTAATGAIAAAPKPLVAQPPSAASISRPVGSTSMGATLPTKGSLPPARSLDNRIGF